MTRGLIDSFVVSFPDDSRTGHRLFFAEYNLSQKVLDYAIFIGGIEYDHINQNISFSHFTIGDLEGIEFRSSDIALRGFTVTVLVIYKKSVLRTNARISSKDIKRDFSIYSDYQVNPPMVMIESFKNLYHNSSIEIGMSVRGNSEGGDEFWGSGEIETTGEEVTYRIIQLVDYRCGEGFLLHDEDRCLAVRQCLEGYFEVEGDLEKRVCKKCHENCLTCQDGNSCSSCLLEGGDISNLCRCGLGFYHDHNKCEGKFERGR